MSELEPVSGPELPNSKTVHIRRHGQAIHKCLTVKCVQRGYPLRERPLTDQGLAKAGAVSMKFEPDLIICSPMGVPRAILAAAFPRLDFSRCKEKWDYEAHSDEVAIQRAGESARCSC
ncbi:hypothetical protein DFH09DRAFT_1228116 [Mycena vulgaris]|nr:hypothetical protein DFH09DRAFT_1228116 [Mycena vulgaris]